MTLSFDAAFAASIMGPSNEGGLQLSKISNDPGGTTFAGISRRYHPDWYGWQLIDAGEPLNSPRLIDLVKSFYLQNFWNPINSENLSPRLAQQVFDMAINSGIDDAAKALQRALGVKDDGNIGPKTVGASRAADQVRLTMRFLAERAEHFADTPQAKQANIGGWFNRLAAQLRSGSQ